MNIIKEEIAIWKNPEPYVFYVRETHHGPVISDIKSYQNREGFTLNEEELFPSNISSTVLSLRWTALDTTNIIRSIYLLNISKNWEDFKIAMEYWSSPPLNIIYADVEGNIGYIAAGLAPIRLKGDGRLPVPGWIKDYEWIGYVPYNRLPQIYNPEKGYIVTANNPIVSWRYPYSMDSTYYNGYRAARINEMIEELGTDISINDIINIHGDVTSPAAKEMIPYLKNILFNEPVLEEIKDKLLEWDCFMTEESPEGAFFAYFWKSVVEETFKDQYPEDRWPASGSRLQSAIYFLLQEPDNPWWDNTSTNHIIERRDDILRLAFEKAYNTGRREFGKDLDSWNWGEIHTIIFKNRTLDNQE